MAEESRLKNSMKNTVFGMVGMFITLIVSFISKSVFIDKLGSAFNGLDYLFKGILNALNLAELGFASAIAFSLYKPLSEGDEETISALMNFFKKVYRIIAVIVGVAGAICIPFLQFLIKEDISTLPFSINELRTYFSLYVLNTVLSYLLAYKRTIISADQKAYIVTTADYASNIILNIAQIALMFITDSYYVFLGLMLIKTVVTNIVLNVIANKKYPFLLKYKEISLLPEEKKKLFYNVKALLLHKIGTVVIGNSGTIVVSAIVGVFENSLYGNYILIASQASLFINTVFNSATASVGNLCTKENINKQIEIFNNMHYLSLWLGYFSFICFICLFNPFMTLWLGEKMIFDMPTVIMLSCNQSIFYLRRALITFRDAKGLFQKDKYKPVIEAIVGISLAILLGKVWGVFGILLGYTLGTVLVAIPVEQLNILLH